MVGGQGNSEQGRAGQENGKNQIGLWNIMSPEYTLLTNLPVLQPAEINMINCENINKVVYFKIKIKIKYLHFW